jgi:hypothetical protein
MKKFSLERDTKSKKFKRSQTIALVCYFIFALISVLFL